MALHYIQQPNFLSSKKTALMQIRCRFTVLFTFLITFRFMWGFLGRTYELAQTTLRAFVGSSFKMLPRC